MAIIQGQCKVLRRAWTCRCSGVVRVGDLSEKRPCSRRAPLLETNFAEQSQVSRQKKEMSISRLSSATMMESKSTQQGLPASSHIVSRSAKGVIDNVSPDTLPKSTSVWGT